MVARSRRASTAVKYLQRTVDELIPWYAEWPITINTGKTEAIYFSAYPQRTPGEILVDIEEMPWCEDVTYLGVKLDWALSFKQHALHVAQRARIKRLQLVPLLRSEVS